MDTQTLQVGSKVSVTRNANSWLNGAVWWPKDGMTGTITKMCKNGTIYVACDQLHNNSEDGLLTKAFTKKCDVTIAVR